MPRYYFHFRDGSSIFEDDVGEVFADVAFGKAACHEIARELARGGEPTNAAIVVVEGGQHLFAVPLAEQGELGRMPIGIGAAPEVMGRDRPHVT